MRNLRKQRQKPAFQGTRLAGETLEQRRCLAAVASLTPSAVSVFEGDAFEFEVSLNAPVTNPERVEIVVAGDTASLGTDVGGPGRWQMLFAPGEQTKTFSIRTVLEAVPRSEGDETFTVSARTVGSDDAVARQVTIMDRIAEVLRSEDVVVTEGDDGTNVTAAFVVEISEPAEYDITVNYATRDGSARSADGDYDAVEGTLIFPAGETSQTVEVTINGDGTPESNEFFFFDLFTPSLGVNIVTPRLTGSIINNDEVVARPPSVSAFQIQVVYDDPTIDVAWRESVQNAVNKWQEVIVGDLPDVDVAGDGTDVIDDFRINVSIEPLSPLLLGFAGPTGFRGGVGGLPFEGEMTMNSLYADGDGFEGTILHELAHSLGFLPTLWDQLGLLDDTVATNPRFTGTNATREYQTIFVTAETSVPLYEQGQPNDGSYAAHWRDSLFGDEIMVSAADPSAPAGPLSAITVGAFEDIGYEVDYSRADPFTPPPSRTAGGAASDNPSAMPRRSLAARQLPARVQFSDGSLRILRDEAVTFISPAASLETMPVMGPSLPEGHYSSSDRARASLSDATFASLATEYLRTEKSDNSSESSLRFASIVDAET